MTTRRRRSKELLLVDRLVRRHRQKPVLIEDPLIETQEAYAHNTFVSTVLRRLERGHLNCLEDAELVRAWARTVTCSRCGSQPALEGDHIRTHLKQVLQKCGVPKWVPAPGAPVRANLRMASELLDLDKVEASILQFLLAACHGAPLAEVLDAFGDLSFSGAATIVAAGTQLDLAKVTRALSSEARLMSSGLVTNDTDRVTFTRKLTLSPLLLELLTLTGLDRKKFVGSFLRPAPPPTLGLDAFADPAPFETARDLIVNALKTRAHGVNILLVGPTGVGKSEAARLFGQLAGVPIFGVGGSDSSGDSATALERCGSLRLANQLVPRGEALLLFDEMEDLFRWELSLFSASKAAPAMSKQWFGSLLETNPNPIIWCTNQVEGIDPAFLRRFTYAIELKSPGARQRADALEFHVGKDGGLTRSDCEAVAQRYETSPAQFGSAVRAARLLAGDKQPDRTTVEKVLAPVHRLVTGVDAQMKPVFEPSGYRLDSLHCAEDLEALAEQLVSFREEPSPGVSLCLYGPPGTGKSEFVKYLAWRCQRPLVYRRVSDLVSPYVGMTEKNIASAFEEARGDGALLLFDEADSFLRDRKGAQYAWQVTEVNEFLQQLEVFPGLVACTTNLWRELDEAALRRFVFKLEFRFPTSAQVLELFHTFFPGPYAAAGEATLAAQLQPIPNLAPGDFAAVARRVKALRGSPDAAALIGMLAGEAGVKREAPRSAGFQG
jgi:SpoVK/Ycf46/Vps4 family AAA+-type ATPase